MPPDKIREARMKYLTDEKRIKAVTVCFTDLEGRLHMLDYDKKFLLEVGRQPDLRRLVDPRLLAAGRSRTCASASTGRRSTGCRPTSSGPARCWCSARCCERDGTPYAADMRAPAEAVHATSCSRRTAPSPTPPTRSRASCSRAATPSATTTRPGSSSSSRPAATTTRCPATRCARFIDTAAEVQRAMGFANEKDHPEVAPSQFEMNYSYTEAVDRRRPGAALQAALPPGRGAAGHDRVLPAQAGDRRERQRHAHQPVAGARRARTSSTTPKGEDGLSKLGWDFIDRILTQRATTSA